MHTQAQRWAHKRAQEQLQAAKAANLSVPCSTPQEVQVTREQHCTHSYSLTSATPLPVSHDIIYTAA